MTFKYRLQPLLKLDRLQGEALGREARQALQVLEEKLQRYRRAQEVIKEAEAALRELYQQDQAIQLDKREVLQTFLRYQHGVAETCEMEATKAGAVYEQILGQLETKRVAIRTLEKHQERKRREHDAVARRDDAKQADEAWLQRRNGGA
jgi:hypothetical protein